MQFHLGKKQYRFHPQWKITLFTLFFLPCLISLGLWQLDRAEEKEQLIKEYHATISAQPTPINTITSKDKPLDYTPVSLKGRYDNKHQFLLDNRTFNGIAGYEVITPFIMGNFAKIVFINRGWVEQGATREDMPIITAVQGEVTLQGKLHIPIQKTFLVEEMASITSDQWPVVIQYIDTAMMANILQENSLSQIVRLDENMPGVLPRNWQPTNTSADKHIGYAFQWLSLALALIVLYIFANTKKVDG